MIASKVTFSSKTREMLNYRPLSQGDKSKLRKRRVKEFIRELPTGEAQTKELIAAAGYDISRDSQYATGWQFIKGMTRRKEIGYNDGPASQKLVKHWYIPGDAKTTNKVPKREEDEGDKPEPKHEDADKGKDEMTTLPPASLHSAQTLLHQAKEFSWQQNSDSLREFLRWLGY